MKRTFKAFMLLALVSMLFSAVVSAAVPTEPATKENETSKDPLKVAEQYFNAVREGNFDEAVRISVDKKFKNKEIQKKEYANSHEHHPLLDYEIVEVDKTNPDDVKLEVSLTYPEFGKLPATPYSVIKVNNEYVVVVESVVVNYDVETKNSISSTVKPMNVDVSPQNEPNSSLGAVNLSYYSFSNIEGKSVKVGDTVFATTKGQVTIHGWQEWDNSYPYVYYGVCVMTSGYPVAIAKSSWVEGSYQQNGDWFTRYVKVDNGQGRRVWVENDTHSGSVKVAGNVYESD